MKVLYDECIEVLRDNKCSECNEFYQCSVCDYFQQRYEQGKADAIDEIKNKLLQEFYKHTWKHRYKCGLTAEQMRFIEFIILETLYENDLLCEADKKRYALAKKYFWEQLKEQSNDR